MTTLEKPAKGTATKARRKRSRRRQTSEATIMAAAKVRDGLRCRVPGLTFIDGHDRGPLHACHQHHRGAGGNPDLSRTTLQGLITLCPAHHRAYDSGRLKIEPLSPDGMSGPCLFSIRNGHDQWLEVGSTQPRRL